MTIEIQTAIIKAQMWLIGACLAAAVGAYWTAGIMFVVGCTLTRYVTLITERDRKEAAAAAAVAGMKSAISNVDVSFGLKK